MKRRKGEKNISRIPVEKITPSITLNRNIDSTSLMVVTAMIMVWMPLYRPSFWIFNQSTISMTTFGDTAVMINLDIRACVTKTNPKPKTKKRSRVITELKSIWNGKREEKRSQRDDDDDDENDVRMLLIHSTIGNVNSLSWCWISQHWSSHFARQNNTQKQ